MTLLALFIGFVIANVTHWDGQLLFYQPTIALSNLVSSFLIAILSASAGVLISLRTATVRQAQQTLMATIMFPILLLGVAGTFFLTRQEWRNRIAEVIGNIEPILAIIIIVSILVVVCLLLLRAAMARFQRARLILG
jgi:ABC-2 type transport system permease protein